MADILDFAENLEGEEDLKLETSKIYDKIDKDEEIEDIQPKLEEPKKATPIILGKKFTKSTLVHSHDSASDPSNYDEISYLNKHRHWKTFVGNFSPKFNKVTKMILWSSETPPTTGEQWLCTIIPGCSHTPLLENARNIETMMLLI